VSSRPGPPRHEGLLRLLSESEDPRPRGTRRVEWVGEASPLDNPVVAYNLMMGLYTPTQAKAVRLAAARARTRVRAARLLEHDHQHAMAVFRGLSRTYIWERENGYVQDVDWADVDRILGSSVGHEFVDLDALGEGEPRPGPLVLAPRGVVIERVTAVMRAEVGERAQLVQVART
jgi:hypothetical protein